MRAVEQRHLAFVVRRLVVSEHHMQPSLVGRELAGQLLQRQVRRRLDHPEVEGLGLYHHLVGITHLLLDGIDADAEEIYELIAEFIAQDAEEL